MTYLFDACITPLWVRVIHYRYGRLASSGVVTLAAHEPVDVTFLLVVCA